MKTVYYDGHVPSEFEDDATEQDIHNYFQRQNQRGSSRMDTAFQIADMLMQPFAQAQGQAQAQQPSAAGRFPVGGLVGLSQEQIQHMHGVHQGVGQQQIQQQQLQQRDRESRMMQEMRDRELTQSELQKEKDRAARLNLEKMRQKNREAEMSLRLVQEGIRQEGMTTRKESDREFTRERDATLHENRLELSEIQHRNRASSRGGGGGGGGGTSGGGLITMQHPSTGETAQFRALSHYGPYVDVETGEVLSREQLTGVTDAAARTEKVDRATAQAIATEAARVKDGPTYDRFKRSVLTMQAVHGLPDEYVQSVLDMVGGFVDSPEASIMNDEQMKWGIMELVRGWWSGNRGEQSVSPQEAPKQEVVPRQDVSNTATPDDDGSLVPPGYAERQARSMAPRRLNYDQNANYKLFNNVIYPAAAPIVDRVNEWVDTGLEKWREVGVEAIAQGSVLGRSTASALGNVADALTEEFANTVRPTGDSNLEPGRSAPSAQKEAEKFAVGKGGVKAGVTEDGYNVYLFKGEGPRPDYYAYFDGAYFREVKE